MSLKDEMVSSGNYLFRWRSYFPLLSLPVIVLAFEHFKYIGGSATLDHMWEIFCLSIATTGLTLRVLTVPSLPT